jgi:crotonobetainyl-CoA:carnitine CoA-transferase CaiB-like acyl-CoA transferase
LESALTELRVLDFSAFTAGPYCAMLLADMGAEVIRVESPGGGMDRGVGQLDPKGESLVFKTTARNKKSITLNLASPDADIYTKRLVEQSDVLIHNIIPGTSAAKKLAYSRLKKMNPKIIVGAVSGYGQSGSAAQRLCLDPVAQAISGQMWIHGFPGNKPLQAGPRYVDICTGMTLAFSIMTALHYRQKTGKGQLIDIALSDMSIALVQNMSALMLYTMYGEIRKQVGNYGFSSYMDCCEAKDGWVYIAPLADIQWRKFAKAIGREDMIADPKFSNDMHRWENREAIHSIVSQWVAKRTVSEVIAELDKARVVAGRVNTVAQMMEEPTVKAREMIVYLEHPGLGKIPLPGVVPKLSVTPGNIEFSKEQLTSAIRQKII